MSTKLLTKDDLYKRFKIDHKKLKQLFSDSAIGEKETFTEEDVERIKLYRKDNPLSKDELLKRFKIEEPLFQIFINKGMIRDKYYYSEKEAEILKSFGKLRRLGYNDTACLKVLEEVGIPREDNLFEDKRYIQLKDLAETTAVPERTIKFYEKSNVIKKPRIYKNKRFYEQKVQKELELIRDLQHIGYKLNDISALLTSIRRNPSLENQRVKQLEIELKQKKQIINSIAVKLKEFM